MGEKEANGNGAAKRKTLTDIEWGESVSARVRAQTGDYTPEYEVPPKRRPADDRDAAFNYLAWIVDGATGLLEEIRHNDLGLSEDFWVHFYAARREGLMAVRALLDEFIDADSAETQKQSEREIRRERRGNINIDF